VQAVRFVPGYNAQIRCCESEFKSHSTRRYGRIIHFICSEDEHNAARSALCVGFSPQLQAIRLLTVFVAAELGEGFGCGCIAISSEEDVHGRDLSIAGEV
jgi:hypothetical protein